MGQIIPLERHRRQRHLAPHAHLAGAPAALHKTRESDRRQSAPSPSGSTLRRGESLRDRQASMPVSVVVPSCGRPALLEQCLTALTAQQFPPSRYEIIVVDDGPSAATRMVVESFAARTRLSGPQISYIANPGPHGPAAARNRGWRGARGSIIAFTDDDTVPDPAWLVNGMRAFDDDVQAVWGRIIMPLDHEPTDYERDARGLEGAEFVTANCFCPRYVLEELGGFDERFRFAWREDADLYFRLLEREGRIVHAPAAVVVHPIRPASWGVSLKQQKKVLFDALLYKKHPRLYREKIRAHARWDYYLIVLSLLACVFGYLMDEDALAIGGGLVWLGFTARFCLARLTGTVHSPSHIAEMIFTSALIPPTAVFWRLVGALRFKAALF